MRILLLYPPDLCFAEEEYFVHKNPPLGLGYIAAALEKAGHEVKVIDCVVEKWRQRIWQGNYYLVGLSWEDLKWRIQQFRPEVVGISCMFSYQFPNVRKIAELVKEVDLNILVVTGGAHPSGAPSQVMADSNFDYVIIGEGEFAMLSLVNCLEKGTSPETIQGLVHRKNGALRVDRRTDFINDLDTLPFPARHLFRMEEYLGLTLNHDMNGCLAERVPFTSMITSRGCPNRCVFCIIHKVWGRSWRARSPENVVDEIELLVDKYRIREIHFQDDNLTLDRNRMKNICWEILERGIDISWTTPNGVHINTLNDDLLKVMKKSGCYRLFLGIESGNPYMLNNVIRKGLSLERVRKVVKLVKRNGMSAIGFFVLGVPPETKDTMEDTIKFAKSLDLENAWFAIATPYPGTELYEQCRSMGYLENYDLPKLKLGYANISTHTLSSEDLKKTCDRAKREFELNRLLNHPSEVFSKRELRKIWRYLGRKVRGYN